MGLPRTEITIHGCVFSLYEKSIKIEIVDDSYGVIVGCRKESKRYDFPLVDLDPVNKKKPNAQHIHDYCTWFANR